MKCAARTLCVNYYPLSTLIELYHARCCSYHDGRPRCETGGADLAKRLETEGYAGISQELGIDYKEEA